MACWSCLEDLPHKRRRKWKRGNSPLQPGEKGFITSIAPGCAARIENEYCPTEQAHFDAWVEALRPEYKAVTDAATDCGLGGRVHPQIAWAKLEARGAR